MLRLNVKVDIDQALSKLGRVSDEVKEKATVRALNATAEQAKIQAAREIRDAGYGMRIRDIKKSISVRRANKNELRAVINARGTVIPLIKFSARQTATGVSVRVKNGRQVIKGAFIAVTATGRAGVFLRHGPDHREVIAWSGKNAGKKIWSAYQIHELYGPSIPIAFSNTVVQSALLASMREKFPANFRREVRYLSLKT